MHKLKSYITDNLFMIFLSMFTPLFAIASMIFMIQLATYTSIIQLSLLDMAKLYLFILPDILFFTLPITFFVATAMTLFKLSTDNEMVVLFSLGVKPSSIIKILSKPTMLLTMLLLFDFLIIFPHTKVLYRNFINYKKSEAKFNISASEFGHSFGKWLLYIGGKDSNSTYTDIFLFNKDEEEEILISAKRAKIINESSILRLKLEGGEGYTYSKDKFTQINFDTMYINNSLTTSNITYRSALGYWTDSDRKKAKKKMLITNTLLSFFPLLSLFLVATIGITNPRHQKNRIYLYIFLGILAYYALSFGLHKSLGFYTIPLVAIAWLSATYYMYKKNILAKF